MKEKEEQQEDETGKKQWKEGETGESGDLIVEQTGSSKPRNQRILMEVRREWR